MKNEEIHYKEKIIATISVFFPKAKIYLFGSYARGTQKRGSDLDIAIDDGAPVHLSEIGQVREMLKALHSYQNIDIVDFHAVPKVLQDTILEEGILWRN